MNHDMLNKAATASTKDVNHLASLKEKLSDDEYNTLLNSTLGKYIKNKKVINNLLAFSTHTWEISVILEMSHETWFSESLVFLTESFRKLMCSNKNLAVSIIENNYPEIHESLACWHDAYYLQNVNRDMNQRYFVRACFRHLGDTVESVLYPHIKCIYELLSNIEELGISNNKNNTGAMISALIELDKLKLIYKENLCGVSLNQWRNISQHSSYFIQKSSKNIICNYAQGKHSIELSNDDLYDLLCTLNQLQTLQKIAIDFFLVEFMDSINLSSKEPVEVSLETIFGNICNNIGVYGFDVNKVENILGIYHFKLIDTKGTGARGLNDVLMNAYSHILMLKDKGIESIFELYTIKGNKVTEARIELANKKSLTIHMT